MHFSLQYIYIYIHIYTHTYTYTYINISMYIYIYQISPFLPYLGEGLEHRVVVDGGQEEGHLHVLQTRVAQFARDALHGFTGWQCLVVVLVYIYVYSCILPHIEKTT